MLLRKNGCFILFMAFTVKAFTREAFPHNRVPVEVPTVPSLVPTTASSTLVCCTRRNALSVLAMKNKNKSDTSTENTVTSLVQQFREKPAMLILLPFLLLLGVDLVLNLAVLVKRSFEYFLLGQLPSTDPWW